MLLDATSAKSLAAIILISTQGPQTLTPQLPLQAIDRGDSWLIKGTPYSDTKNGMHYCFFHIIVRKNSAEIIEIGFDKRIILSEKEKQHWSKIMKPAEFERIFGVPADFEAGGPDLAVNLGMNSALYGGLVNTPQAAIEYAQVLLQSKPLRASGLEAALTAEERSGVWHVTIRSDGHAAPREVLTFSRRNGKLLSGSL